MREIFRADSMSVSYGRTRVLKSATVWASAGRVSLLMGRNGSGKSTLLRAALGLVRADQGIVRFLGRTHARPLLARLATLGLFYLPDRGLLSRRLTLAEQLALVRARFAPASDPAVVERLGLGGLLDRYPDEVSGGERRLFEIALAATRGPCCFVADEPLAGLEPKRRAAVSAAIRRLAEGGVAVVVTGHDVADLFELADEVLWVVAGTTHGLGTPRAAARHEQFRREYLGPGHGRVARRPGLAS